MAEPTAEHIAEARRALLVESHHVRCQCTGCGRIDEIAPVIAAAEARGAGKRATYVLQADLDAMEERHTRVEAGMLAEIKALTEQVATAEARGFERGRKEGGSVAASVRALYALPEFPHGEWSCGECGNVYPRDIISGCPTCSPAARAALYPKEPR